MNPNGSTSDDLLPELCHKPGHVHGCPGEAGGDHEFIDAEPDPSWTEDVDGYVVVALINQGLLDG